MVDPSVAPSSGAAGVARLFTRGTFRLLGDVKDDGAQAAASLLRRAIPEVDGLSLAAGFDCAMQSLIREYRNEYVFKNTLVDRLVFGRHSPRTSTALLELRAGNSIADVVVFNGTSTAYEIKTDLDGLSRLPAQVASYATCFERVFVLTTRRMAPRIADITPEHIGVLVLNERRNLSTIRTAATNLDRVTPTALFGLLHRSETLRILSRIVGYEPDVPVARLWRRTHELFAELPVETTHPEVVDELRMRGMTAAASTCRLPRSLRAMGYEVRSSTSASKRRHVRLSMRIADFAV